MLSMHKCSGEAEDLLITECGGRWRWVSPARQVHTFSLKQAPSGCRDPYVGGILAVPGRRCRGR